MRIALFYHSLLSDWNHGNAHFLRGIASELLARGHDVRIYEPENGWSLRNLMEHSGERILQGFRRMYPALDSIQYNLDSFDFDSELAGVQLVIVHEWNDAALIERLHRHHASTGEYRLLLHDTHHRFVTERQRVAAYQIASFDGVLAFGSSIRDLYVSEGWAERAWTWHEAAGYASISAATWDRKGGRSRLDRRLGR